MCIFDETDCTCRRAIAILVKKKEIDYRGILDSYKFQASVGKMKHGTEIE